MCILFIKTLFVKVLLKRNSFLLTLSDVTLKTICFQKEGASTLFQIEELNFLRSYVKNLVIYDNPELSSHLNYKNISIISEKTKQLWFVGRFVKLQQN